MRLLTPAFANTKLAKGGGLHDRFLSYILHLAPSDLSGRNVCPNASPGCIAACLNTAGRGAFNSIQTARINKTRRLFEDREQFLNGLFKDLTAVLNKARRENKVPVVRLNGTSDLPWENIKYSQGLSLIALFPEIQFYDYTKSIKRALRSVQDKTWPSNYHLTFSRSETNRAETVQAIQAGVNVAVVFSGDLPKRFEGAKVISGDEHDFRFIDPSGAVVGLTAKGRAKRDQSGFVVSSSPIDSTKIVQSALQSPFRK